MNIKQKINNFIQEVQNYPDIDHIDPENLFAKRNKKEQKLEFFKNILKHLNNPKFLQRVESESDVNNAEEAYERWNDSKSAVRNGLILVGYGFEL